MPRQPVPLRLATILVFALLLAACAHRPSPRGPVAAEGIEAREAYAAQSAREARLAEQPDWRLRGRVAFANGGEGATVQIDWRQAGEAYDIRLVAPVTGRQWRLRGDAGGATLEGLEGGPRHAEDAEALLAEATGWVLPLRQLPAWVRGARGPGPAEALAVDVEARPLGWRQAGWQLRFPDWLPGDPPLPRRVFAERGEASVRLVVGQWEPGP